jgi:hypothetical protein
MVIKKIDQNLYRITCPRCQESVDVLRLFNPKYDRPYLESLKAQICGWNDYACTGRSTASF